MRLLVLFIGFAALAFNAISQEVVVRDADDKTALSKAEVSSPSGIVLFTDRNGVFELDTFLNQSLIFISHAGHILSLIHI